MNDLILKAFAEDIPTGDLTTDGLGIEEKFGIAQLVAKQDLILSGQRIFEQSILHREPEAQISWYFKDGDQILKGQVITQIAGNLIKVIQAERVALNFLGYLSGIATQTRRFVKACEGTKTKILDTRKTLPAYRELSKQAVRDGGGHNHRMNLSSAILIKENHISLAGGLKEAIARIRLATDKPIEIETKNLDEVQEAVNLNVNRIMFDNMDLATMAKALTIVPDAIETEASGNMTLDRIPEVAKLGVDYISVGALTHSVISADVSLLFDWT